MKRILIITAIAIICICGFYTYLTWNSNGNPRFMHHRYNKVVTLPLAKMGVADAQYKMGLFWFYGSGESEPTKEELNNAVYWLEKAYAKGNMKASEELIKVKQRADILNVLSKESDGYAYWQAVEYCSRAVNYIEELNDASALEYTMKAFLVLEKLGLQGDDLYSVCTRLLAEIETLAKQNRP